MLGLTYWSYMATPKGFVPTQDMGYLLVAFQLPDAASAERTAALTERVEKICKTVPGVKNLVTYNGQSFLLSVNGSNFSSMFVMLNDFDERQTPDLYADEIADQTAAEVRPRSARGQGRRRRGAADPRHRPHGRVQVRGGRPRRRRFADAGATDGEPRGQGQRAARGPAAARS